MKASTQPFRVLAMIIFSVGVVAGLCLSSAATAADLEAMFYGFEKLGDTSLPNLKCPILMTRGEVGQVSVVFTNSSDRNIEFMTRADISGALQLRSERAKLALPPGESRQMTWTVSAEDVDLGAFIFVKVWNYPAYQLPIREASCGILVLDLPGWGGMQLFTLIFAICLLGILFGYSGWELSAGPMEGRTLDITRGMKFLGVLVLLGLLVSMQGTWPVGILLITVALLMIGVTLGFVLSR